ncbi:MAG: HDOD domain-containing protein [Dehalococcoidia bacterium]
MLDRANGTADLDLLVEEVAELRPLPSVAVRVLEIAESEHFSAHELAQAIASDAALTARMLRLANSAYYGFPRRISTVRDAVVLLGFRAVRSATLATCVIGAMPRGSYVDERAFWHFSLSVGMLAEVLSRATHQHTDHAFTAGVLHNIGRLALDQHRPETLREVVRCAREQGIGIPEAERRMLGYTDADIGHALALHWNFPAALADAVSGSQGTLDDLGRDSLAAQVVRARAFAHARGLSDGVDLACRAEPAREWLVPPVASVLEQGGGLGGVVHRASAFVERAIGV